MAVSAPATEVLLPASREEAIEAFGDGAGVTVLAGGTILMPEIAEGRLRPGRTLLLVRAGLGGVHSGSSTIRIGATTTVAELAELGLEPLASAAANVADLEVRSQGTVGGNLCAPPGREFPRGDLQAPLLALAARVRSAGPGGERVDEVDSFLAGEGTGRLVLELELDGPPDAAAHAVLDRPHAHSYTPLAVAAAERDGVLRIAATGAAPRAVRLHAVESSRDASDALADADPQDDALASAWYRRKMLPVLVARVLADLKEAR